MRSLETAAHGARLSVATPLAAQLRPGDSVAVNGVCLTAVAAGGGAFSVDVMSETLDRSSLAHLFEGASVNLELPVRASDRLGGHIVQGHVDGMGRILQLEPEGGGARLTIEAPEELVRYVVEKGSITVEGVSLTIAALAPESFEIALVPHTLTATTLGSLAPGDEVNLEVDVLAKYVERLLEAHDAP